MEVLLLGTAAAEGWPCPWCTCPACAEARRRGGRDLRTRPGALMDGVVKVDFGPDTLSQMQRAGRDLAALTTLVFTHAHDDHFTPAELQYRGPHFVTRTPLPTLHVYGNAEVMETLPARLEDDPATLHMAFHAPLRPFEAVATPDGTEILPLPAAHAPGALLLRLTRGGRRVFYGHDSGVYPEETVRALAGAPLDLTLFDCTYGPAQNAYMGHLGVPGVVEMAARLRSAGAVTDDTALVATHFSHNGGVCHDALVRQLAPHGIQAAYDGLMIEI